MKSTPGSALAAPFEGDVKSVPSIRKVFSLVPEPKAEIVLMVTARRRRGRDPWCGPGPVGKSGSSSWDRGEILGAEASSHARVPSSRARDRALDVDGLRDTGKLQDNSDLGGRADSDQNVFPAIGRESGERHIDHVGTGRQVREAQLAFRVGGRRFRSAD